MILSLLTVILCIVIIFMVGIGLLISQINKRMQALMAQYQDDDKAYLQQLLRPWHLGITLNGFRKGYRPSWYVLRKKVSAPL